MYRVHNGRHGQLAPANHTVLSCSQGTILASKQRQHYPSSYCTLCNNNRRVSLFLITPFLKTELQLLLACHHHHHNRWHSLRQLRFQPLLWASQSHACTKIFQSPVRTRKRDNMKSLLKVKAQQDPFINVPTQPHRMHSLESYHNKHIQKDMLDERRSKSIYQEESWYRQHQSESWTPLWGCFEGSCASKYDTRRHSRE